MRIVLAALLLTAVPLAPVAAQQQRSAAGVDAFARAAAENSLTEVLLSTMAL